MVAPTVQAVRQYGDGLYALAAGTPQMLLKKRLPTTFIPDRRSMPGSGVICYQCLTV